jgi:hypothetical protein
MQFIILEGRPQGAGATFKWKIYFLTGQTDKNFR